MVRVLLSTFVSGAVGHGWMTEPPTRAGATLAGAGSCPYGACLWFNQGCTIGCPKCGGIEGSETCGSQQGKATLPDHMRTYNLGNACGTNPWCAPGSSPMMNPCGVAAGGDEQGKAGNGNDNPPGYKYGDKGTEMRNAADEHRTWKAGEAVEVAWAVTANHGGGYQYRLCRKPANYLDLTEECFQAMPLAFSGSEQELQFCENANPQQFPAFTHNPEPFAECEDNRTTIPAVDVSYGTVPEGSVWRRNPIPGCFNSLGVLAEGLCGLFHATSDRDFMFPSPGPDPTRSRWNKKLGGYGVYAGVADAADLVHAKKIAFQFNVVDKLIVPMVPPGDYVVGFRWDCEMAAQIWLSCSDVTITSAHGPQSVV